MKDGENGTKLSVGTIKMENVKWLSNQLLSCSRWQGEGLKYLLLHEMLTEFSKLEFM